MSIVQGDWSVVDGTIGVSANRGVLEVEGKLEVVILVSGTGSVGAMTSTTPASLPLSHSRSAMRDAKTMTNIRVPWVIFMLDKDIARLDPQTDNFQVYGQR